jgi:hypothetical protein
MKNKLLFCFVAILFCCQICVAQTLDATPKKWDVGGSVVAGPFLGGELKADYFLKEKLSFGISVLGGTSNRSSAGISKYFESVLTSTYYLLGNNCTGKGGLYLRGGLGYIGKRYQYSAIGEGIYSSTYSYAANGFGGHVSLGTDLKIGPGRLFFELQNSFMILGKAEQKTISTPTWGLYLKLGYVIHF